MSLNDTEKMLRDAEQIYATAIFTDADISQEEIDLKQHWLAGMKKLKACEAAIEQESFIANRDYSYENGEKVKQADRAYLQELKKVAGMI